MYVLHYAPDNASLIVRLALLELGAPFDTALVDRSVRAQDGPAYRRLNPNGLIPALETPEGALFETGAILLWLSERHGALAPAPGNPERGHFLKWLFFVSNTLHADARLFFYAERHAGQGADVAAFRAATLDRIAGHLGLLEAMATTRPAWFSTDTPSVLTLYVCGLLRWIALYPVEMAGWLDLARYPALRAIAAATEARPSAAEAARMEGLGTTIFTQPSYACPPEGSAT